MVAENKETEKKEVKKVTDKKWVRVLVGMMIMRLLSGLFRGRKKTNKE